MAEPTRTILTDHFADADFCPVDTAQQDQLVYLERSSGTLGYSPLGAACSLRFSCCYLEFIR